MKKAKIAIGIIVCIALLGCAAYGIYTQVGAVRFGEMTIDGVPEKADGTTRIMSFNVRCANDGEQTITNRSKVAIEMLKAYMPDSFGVQECTPRWKRIFYYNLGDKYACTGKARDYYGPFTEYSAIYYLKDKYELIDSGTIWLSDTPDVFASKFKFSFCPRIATWVVLENKADGTRYTHINTHLDHVLESVRVKQIEVLSGKIAELEAMGYPVVCTGDFNTKQGADAYNKMSEAMADSKLIAANSDDGATYINYGRNRTETKPIDFIFVSNGVSVDRYKIIDEKIDRMYLSDHAGLCADVRF